MPSRSYLPRSAAIIWAVLLILCALATIQRLRMEAPFDTSVLALLPGDEQSAEIDAANRAMSDHFANHILLLVGSDSASPEQLRLITSELFSQLQASREFSQVSSGVTPSIYEQLSEFYLPFRYQLLTPEDRESLQQQRQQQLQERALSWLYSPASLPRAASITDDPLGLLQNWLQSLLPSSGFKSDTWGLSAEDDRLQYRVITAEFDGDPFATGQQRRLLKVIEDLEMTLAKAAAQSGNQYVLLRSGLLFHAAAGANQARQEISSIGIGSAILVIALLLWRFRSPVMLILPLLSICAGLLVAMTVALHVFDRVHLVTLAFGASLVGVSIDYAMHYLCSREQLGNRALSHVLPGLSLGLISSVLAYAAQALTPFPGLRQMAVFSAAGLVGAWLTVVCWFPCLPIQSGAASQQLSNGLKRLSKLHRPLSILAVILGVLAVAGWSGLRFDDDVGSLQSSPPELLQAEQKIQTMSQRAGSARYFLAGAETTEQLLTSEESLRSELDKLIADGRLQSYQALSNFVPSAQRQRADFELIEAALYEDPKLLQEFFAKLGAPELTVQLAEQSFARQPQQWLSPEDWQQSRLGRLFPYLWLGSTGTGTEVYSVISLGAVSGVGALEQLRQLADHHPGIRFVDRVERTSTLLARYRTSVSLWLLLSYCAVTLLLWWRFGRATWRVLFPPLAATLITFGVLALSGHALNLFNVLAALLILGIGLDTGIFLCESKGQTHTWEAITLSSLSSVFAFGLLALSTTPVLHHFGKTVLLGITLTWLLAFLTAFTNSESQPDTRNFQRGTTDHDQS